tara:strand:+ start:134 stop:1522 length:1389 start_codon:yes stop_codon:yes gene_type:complete
MGVDATSTGLTTNGTWVITADGDAFFMLSPNSGVTITLNPERDGSANYMFPEGHIIEVCNDGDGSIVFDNQTSPTGLNATLSSGHRATFIYEGSVWVRCDYQSAIIGLPDPAIEINSGTPAFASGITKAEVQTLLNIADGATANAGTVTSIATSAPITGGTITGSGTIGISAATTSAAGSMSSADKTKLDGIAASATAYADADAIAAVEGEATLALTGDVTIAAGKGLTVDGTTLHVDAANDRVGIGTASPATALHVEGSNHVIRVKDTSAGDNALTRTMGGLELSAAGMNTTSKFGVPIKFMSTDSAFTTENPKFLAAIVPIARESYTTDTKGAMAIGFAVTAGNPGASTVPQVKMTLDSNGRLGIGTGGPQALLHVAGTIRQTTVTNAVLVADSNGDLAAASNLADLAYLAPGGAQTDTFTPTTSAASWAAPAPTTIQQAIDRLAAYVVALPGAAPPQIP